MASTKTPTKPTKPGEAPAIRSELPEDTFWSRFSSFHEFPLSAAAAIGLFLLCALIVALGIRKEKETNADKPPEFDNVFAGGGGEGESAGALDGEDLIDFRLAIAERKPSLPLSAPLPLPTPGGAGSVIDDLEAAKRLARGSEDALRSGDAGRGGPGSGGGKGAGHGKGEGDGVGPGKAKSKERLDRRDRWAIPFDFDNPEAYVAKLRELKVVLAVPLGKDQYRIYDLVKGLDSWSSGTGEDVAKLNRIWWEDEKRENLPGLARLLGLPATPPRVYILLPRALEDALAAKELEFARVKTEEEIRRRNLETIFNVTARGDGWNITVLEQRAKGARR